MHKMRSLAILMVGLMMLGESVSGQCGGSAFTFGNNLCGAIGTFTINPNVACKPFNLVSGCGGNWFCVAVTPNDSTTPLPNRDIAIGGVASTSSGGKCDFLVANGHLGGLAPTSGQITLVANSGMSRARLANTQTMSPLPNNGGWMSGNHSFAASSVARLFQFNVTCPGTFTVQLNQVVGPSLSALRWRLYAPGSDSSWRPRSSMILGGSGTSPSGPISLSPGWHAIVVFKDGAPVTANLNYSVTVTRLTNPAPVINSASQLVACSGPTTLTLSGSNFLQPCTTVAVDGNPVSATITPNSIAIPLPNYTTPGNLTVSVTNPPPGGGTATINVPIASAATPAITGCSPPSAPYGGGPMPMTIQGANFTPTSVVLLNSAPKSTLFVNSSALTITFTSADLLSTMPLCFQVVDPCSTNPSPMFSCPIICPSPSVTSLSPSMVAEGCGTLMLSVTGTGFCPNSTLNFNGLSIGPATSSPTFLTFNIPGSETSLAATFNVTVTTPGPGGGTSTGVPFTVRLPSPGTQEDFVLATGVNGPATTGPGQTIKTAPAGSTLLFEASSPMGTVVNRPFFIVADFFPTNPSIFPCNAPIPGPIWVGSMPVTFALVGPPAGTLVSLSPLVQPGPNQFAFTTPLGLAGNSILIQALVLTPLATVVPNVMLSDGHEIRF